PHPDLKPPPPRRSSDLADHSATCTAKVTVVDDTPPTVGCADITQNADAGVCNASVTFAATAKDNCSVTVAYDIGGVAITSPHTFHVRKTTLHSIARETS